MPLLTKASVKNTAKAIAAVRTADTGSIRPGGIGRLPVKTTDTGKIRLGGACRLPVKGA